MFVLGFFHFFPVLSTLTTMGLYEKRRYCSYRDLLSSDRSDNKMEIKMNPEGGLHVPGLKSIEVHNVDDVNRVCSII